VVAVTMMKDVFSFALWFRRIAYRTFFGRRVVMIVDDTGTDGRVWRGCRVGGGGSGAFQMKLVKGRSVASIGCSIRSALMIEGVCHLAFVEGVALIDHGKRTASTTTKKTWFCFYGGVLLRMCGVLIIEWPRGTDSGMNSDGTLFDIAIPPAGCFSVLCAPVLLSGLLLTFQSVGAWQTANATEETMLWLVGLLLF